MHINVIIRNDKGVVLDTLNINGKKSKINDLASLNNYVQKWNKKEFLQFKCEYDIECKKEYIYSLAKRRKKLDFDVSFEDLYFSDYCKITKSNNVCINAYLVVDGIGGCGNWFSTIELVLFILDLIKKAIHVIKMLFTFIFPFYGINKKYGYGKKFVEDIILRGYEWNYEFFSISGLKFNRILEISIMRKLGYKLKKKKWIFRRKINSYSCIKKYDKY